MKLKLFLILMIISNVCVASECEQDVKLTYPDFNSAVEAAKKLKMDTTQKDFWYIACNSSGDKKCTINYTECCAEPTGTK